MVRLLDHTHKHNNERTRLSMVSSKHNPKNTQEKCLFRDRQASERAHHELIQLRLCSGAEAAERRALPQLQVLRHRRQPR